MSFYVFADNEKPTSAGSPYMPRMTAGRRIAYVAVGVFIGLMTTFPNALTTVNLGTIAGSLGLYGAEASWLPALCFGMNAGANLALVKARAQFGIPRVVQSLLVLYALVAALQLVWPGFIMAAAARIANGIETAALTSLSIYYFLVALTPKWRPVALVLGLSLTQFGTPLARLVPVELLSIERWQGMHWIELAVPLAVLAAILMVPLPPSDRVRAFEPTDLASIALLVPGIVLGCEVLGLGRAVWWHDTPWLGAMLAGCVVLLAAGICIEASRKRPLLQLKWLSTMNIARFIGIALLMRLALAEQTFGSVGLLSEAGLNNDQMHTLFLLVALSMAAGAIAAVLTLSEKHLPWQVMLAALCIGASALLDSRANSLTRPAQLYLSQSLIGFGTTLFIGPTMLYGFIQMMRKGADHYITLVVIFSLTQNVGALAGSAIIGSYQVVRTHVHLDDLSAQLVIGNAGVGARLGNGVEQLRQAAAREASVLAYNDVFGLLARLAGAAALSIGFSLFLTHLRQPSKKAAS